MARTGGTPVFQYEFMQKAFITGLLLSVIIPCIGVVVVLKRFSMMGDALSHASLAGIAGGLVLGVNPVAGAIVTSVFAALGIEALRKRFPLYGEIAVAVVMSLGLGLAGVLSGFVPGGAAFTAFLFGSIVAISTFELVLVAGTSIVVCAVFMLLYNELFFIALDERQARLSGVRVNTVNIIFTVLTAITISVASRTVGALVVSSLMVIPAACAMQCAKSYKQTVALSILFAVACTLSGITVSYYTGFKPGGTIVLISVALLVALLAVRGVRKNA
jgi:zinc transport system permease protein